MIYTIKFDKAYIKELDRISTHDQKQIRFKVHALATNPRPEGCEKLHRASGPPLYRIRCGNYRVVYLIQDNLLIVLVLDVGD